MIKRIKLHCHKVLPLVYDDSLSYYEEVCQVVNKCNEVVDTVNEVSERVDELESTVNDHEERIAENENDIAENKEKLNNHDNTLERNSDDIDELKSGKQDKLTAGDGVTISNNVISCNSVKFFDAQIDDRIDVGVGSLNGGASAYEEIINRYVNGENCCIRITRIFNVMPERDSYETHLAYPLAYPELYTIGEELQCIMCVSYMYDKVAKIAVCENGEVYYIS